jgi:hypothetical protein
LQTFLTNLVLTKFSGPKRHAVPFTMSIFASFCGYHTDFSGGEGRWDRPAQQIECPYMAKIWLFIWRLSASQTSKHFLPEVRNVAFCILVLKNDFVILAEV